MVALNTMCRKPPQKQVTYRTTKGVEKQLDCIMTDRKHNSWSHDAEDNDSAHGKRPKMCHGKVRASECKNPNQ